MHAHGFGIDATHATPSAADDRRRYRMNAPRRLRQLGAYLRTAPSAAAPPSTHAAVDEEPAEMSDKEKFLFDLQGFLAIPSFLSEGEVAALNASFEANWGKRGDCHQTPAYDEFGGMLTWEQPYCQPFRDLLAHPKLVKYLNTMMGRGWRLDHQPFMITGTAETKISKGMAEDAPGGGGGHGFSGPFFNGECYYRCANGVMRTGMLVCQYQLTDVNEGDGGLGLIPGSHKMNFAMPATISASWRNSITPPVHNPPANAGDLIIFLEATQHGTLPWFGKGERRSLFYRYSPKYLNYVAPYYETMQPAWVTQLGDSQQAVLEPVSEPTCPSRSHPCRRGCDC